MPRPDINAILADIEEHISPDIVDDFVRLSYCDQRELFIPQCNQHQRLRKLIHHAFYYHTQKWLRLSEEEACELTTALLRMSRLEDCYFHRFHL